MDEDKKKQVMIAITIICILLAVIIFFAFGTGGNSFMKGTTSTGPVPMLCVNPDCEYVFELSRDDYGRQMMENQPEIPMGPMMGPTALECPECGEKSAYVAIKCEKCKHVFMASYEDTDDYRDRCPECGYSAIEEAQSKRKK